MRTKVSSSLLFGLCVSFALVGIAFADESDFGLQSGNYPTPQVGVTSITGFLHQVKAVTSITQVSTTSTAYVDMPDMTITIHPSGSARLPALVTFNGEWIGNTGRALIRCLVDNVVVPGPGDATAPFAPHEGTVISTNGWTFITQPLATNVNHVIKIQWTLTGAGTISVDERVLVVQYP